MKFIFKLTLLMLVVVSMIQCKKDPVDIGLSGQWKMTDIHCDNGESVVDPGGLDIMSTFSFHGTSFNAFTTFTENPDEFSSTGSYTASYTTVTFGISTTQNLTIPVFEGTGQWSINGDTLIQVFGGGTTKLIILEKNDSVLRLRNDVDVIIQDGGTDVYDKATVFSTFEKQ